MTSAESKGGNLLGSWGGWSGEGRGDMALSKTSSCAFFFKKVSTYLFFFFWLPWVFLAEGLLSLAEKQQRTGAIPSCGSFSSLVVECRL